MARKKREKTLSGRVDDDAYDNALAYVESAEIGIADLVRLSVAEYIINHPINQKG